MLNSMVDWAVGNRLLVALGLIVALAGSIMSLRNLNLDAFPDVTNIQVQVNTETPGLAAEEVEQLVTYPIEAVMYSLPDVEEVRSISKTGLSIISVVFKEGTDIYFARQLVFEQLQAARENIPGTAGTPEMGINTSGLGMVFQYVLLADADSNLDTMQLRSLNDWVVKLLLLPVDGVTDVLSFGGEVLQYQVQLDPAKMLSYRLAVSQVVEAIEANNRNAGGWYVNRGAEQLVLRAVGWIRSGADGLADLGNIPVKEVDGVVVRVKDVARLELGGEIRQGAVTMTSRTASGKPQARGEVVAGIVLKRMGANTNATIQGIYDRLPLIAQALPDGVTLQPYYDQADLIDKAITTVTRAPAASVCPDHRHPVDIPDEPACDFAGVAVHTAVDRPGAERYGPLGYFGQPDVVGRSGDSNRHDGGRNGSGNGKYFFALEPPPVCVCGHCLINVKTPARVSGKPHGKSPTRYSLR